MLTLRQLLDRKGHNVYSVEPDAPVLEALRIMAEHHIGALLVIGGGKLTGILSERDYARKVALKGRSSSETPTREIMSSPVVTATPESTVDEAMRTMTQRRIRHLPVVQDGRVEGLVSIGDLVKSVIEDQKHQIEELEHYIAHG